MPPNKDQRQSTQNHLMFTEIRDGVVVMRDSSLRMIILASPVNFDLMSSVERDGIEYAYQGFLNGLHFPIQVLIRSRRADLDGYLSGLEKTLGAQKNELLSGLMKEYIYNLKSLVSNVNIMAKEFFIIVPFTEDSVDKARDNIITKVKGLFTANNETTQSVSDFDRKKRDLFQRTNMVAQGLASMGVRSAVLNTQEVIELFYSSYNLNEAITQSLISVHDMTTPVVTRSEKNPTPHRPDVLPATPDDLYQSAQKRLTQFNQPNSSVLPGQKAPSLNVPQGQNDGQVRK